MPGPPDDDARRRLEGRRIWFVGIGGAGMSGYALLAREWGAEVGGWDRVETPYLRPLAGTELRISSEPEAPEGWDVVVSTAYAGAVAGRSRAEFLSELVSLQQALVVAGAHGKGTTAAMIAFVLDRLGRDPAFLVGAEIPQLGGNARAGSGWLVVEGDESDRTVFALRPEAAVVTNVDLDHHTEFSSQAELERLFDEWLAEVPRVVRCDPAGAAEIPLTVPGSYNRRNAACALSALELVHVSPQEAAPVLAEFGGLARRFELRGEAGGVRVVDDYGHHPTELEAVIASAREISAARVLVLFQPHLYSRTLHLAREFGDALAAADAVAVTDVYRAREEPIDGVSGKLVVDAVAEARHGMPVAWTPRLEDAVTFVAAHAHAGDVVLTVGAGDIDSAVPLLLEALR